MRGCPLIQHVVVNAPYPPSRPGGFSLATGSNGFPTGRARKRVDAARRRGSGRVFTVMGRMILLILLTPCPAYAASLLIEGGPPNGPLRHRLVISADPDQHPGRRPKAGLTCGATPLSEMYLVLDFDLGPRWTQPAYAVAVEADGKRLTTLSMAGQLVYLVSRSPEVRRLSRVALTARRLTFETGGSTASFDLAADPDEIEQFRRLCGLDI